MISQKTLDKCIKIAAEAERQQDEHKAKQDLINNAVQVIAHQQAMILLACLCGGGK